MGKIRSNDVKKSKDTVIVNRFFHTLHGKCLLKQQVVVVQTPEREFKANIARNGTFEG